MDTTEVKSAQRGALCPSAEVYVPVRITRSAHFGRAVICDWCDRPHTPTVQSVAGRWVPLSK